MNSFRAARNFFASFFFRTVFRSRPFLLFCSVVLLVVSFPPFSFRWAIFFALVPIFFFLDGADRKKAFWGGLFFGFLLMGWSLHWMLSIAPLDWAGISSRAAGITLLGTGWLVSSFALSICFGMFCAGWSFIPARYRIALIPALWVVLEYIRGSVFSVLWMGKEGSMGSYWTFGDLGYAFSNFPVLLQSSKILGLYGASFVFVLANVALYELLKKRGRGGAGVLAAAAMFAFLLVYGFDVVKTETAAGAVAVKNAALIQTNFTFNILSYREEVERAVKEEYMLFEKAAAARPDLLVVPETSPTVAVKNAAMPQFLDETFGAAGDLTAIYTTRTYEYAPLSILWYHPGIGFAASSQKSFLVPGGEYVPYLLRFPLRMIGGRRFLDSVERVVLSRKGNPDIITAFGGENLPREGVLACSAIFAPDLWRAQTKSFAQILVNPANQAAFQGSFFHQQEEGILRFIAAMNDRWFLQATNGGFSYIIDSHGTVRARSDKNNSVLSGFVEYRDTKSYAVRYGEWMLWVSFGLLLACFSRDFLKNNLPSRLWGSIIKELSSRA